MARRLVLIGLLGAILAGSASAIMTLPGVLWNTFQGPSSGVATVSGVAADAWGNIVVGGNASGTWGTPVVGYQGGTDAYVVKLAPNGAVVWSTFLGGFGWDGLKGLAVDRAGNVYVVGTSNLTWGAPVRPFSGGECAFAAKLDWNGNLLWNTFLNGDQATGGGGIAVNDKNEVFVSGYSACRWGTPVTQLPLGSVGAFVAKLSPAGALAWNTFGPAGTYASGITLAGTNPVVTGYGTLPFGSALKKFSGGWDAFVLKLGAGGARCWFTFLGGPDEDYGTSLAADAKGDIYVAGRSRSTWGAPLTDFAGGYSDGFVARLSPAGARRWNTFIGGTDSDEVRGLALSPSGGIYLGGSSNATWGTPFRPFSDLGDAFAARMTTAGGIAWNGFLGGNGFSTAGQGVAFSPMGDIIVAGESSGSWGYPILPYPGGIAMVAASVIETGLAVYQPRRGDVVMRGTDVSIRWTDRIPQADIAIDLMKGTTVALSIASSAPNIGQYTWSIPAAMLPAKGVAVRVRTLDGAFSALGLTFDIVKGTFIFDAPVTGASWARGTTAAIQWQIVGNPGPSVALHLCDSLGRVKSTIKGTTPNDGSYDWTIPRGLLPKTYRIRIQTTDGTVKQLSDPFTIF